ncbi:hypothetical protein TRIATDRAFT_301508 [Trichoderma atroviride IMI 206040]|uniref:Uncharacterized protein n=1 Tax=Hypocrea atroviridis (strain ATCC 20476 / IMI 206040) TaxID=452589 RepID=G9P6Y8_HYPAI|nr:uncharacterized protein TRIATDRAFT_301508 [Trichoderma atroviride IMI 206040]EHK40713.1 hypothetical protein TRIATDRAFT_301508 [Trichoderma atroviride IMI 206040]
MVGLTGEDGSAIGCKGIAAQWKLPLCRTAEARVTGHSICGLDWGIAARAAEASMLHQMPRKMMSMWMLLLKEKEALLKDVLASALKQCSMLPRTQARNHSWFLLASMESCVMQTLACALVTGPKGSSGLIHASTASINTLPNIFSPLRHTTTNK